MAMTMKHLIRPYINITSTVLCRSHQIPRNAILHLSTSLASIKVQTLTTSPFSLPTRKTLLKNGSGRWFSGTTRATSPHNVNDPGSIDSPLMQSMEIKIKDELNAESVIVKDAYGDGRHVSIVVVSSSFEGKSAVNRQRMVYKAIWEELQSTVHAVDQMITKTPSEASQNK